MHRYYMNVRQDSRGYNEVHKETCIWLPNPENRYYIGEFSNCQAAIAEAKRQHPLLNPDGCKHCSEPCHNG
ncbi:hypothetical protein KFE98_17160 [bacterium SCSIO 12741]|nr:hypothetical protein KFE98_17160 [bacterium SCSIO 12741]